MTRLLFLFALLVVGCTRLRPEPVSLSNDARPSVESSSIADCVRGLMSSPVDQSLSIPADFTSANLVYPIPTPQDLASDGCSHTLHVDSASGTAWIAVSGGIADHIHETSGPWRASHPDVRQLIRLVSGENQLPD
jgi:hypothetical protein